MTWTEEKKKESREIKAVGWRDGDAKRMIERPRRKGGDWESGEEWVGGFREREKKFKERKTSALGFVEREREWEKSIGLFTNMICGERR